MLMGLFQAAYANPMNITQPIRQNTDDVISEPVQSNTENAMPGIVRNEPTANEQVSPVFEEQAAETFVPFDSGMNPFTGRYYPNTNPYYVSNNMNNIPNNVNNMNTMHNVPNNVNNVHNVQGNVNYRNVPQNNAANTGVNQQTTTNVPMARFSAASDDLVVADNNNGGTNINDGTTNNVTGGTTGITNISAPLTNSAVAGHIPGQVAHHGFLVHSDVRGTRFEEAAEVLGALGIMIGDEGGFRPNDTIIRSEVAKIAVYMLGLTEIAGGTSTRFPDVGAGHWAAGVINVADTQRMVIGYEDGTFRPSNYISFAEAVTIVVRALGFEPAAQAAGGFPTGYLVVASQQGLLRGVQGASNEPARRGDVAQLVYNALTTYMMEQTGFGTNITYTIVERTILWDRLGVERGIGQITGTFESRLTGTSSFRSDEVEINDEVFFAGNTPARALLGFSVVYYARENRTTSEKTLILVRPERHRNNTITVNSSHIVGVTGTPPERLTFSYWLNRDTDREPRRAIIAANATLIYNGRHEPLTAANIDDLHPSTGNVTLLNTRGGTDEFNVVFVNSFRNVVIQDISLQTGRVSDRYGREGVVFDRDNTDVYYSIVRDGQRIRLEDLREWDVLSVTESRDGNLIRAFVSTARVEGMITEISGSGDETRYGINRVMYERAPYFDYELRLQTEGIFFLDIEGRIAAVDTTRAAERNYAYLLGIAEVGTFNTQVQFRLFMRDGETIIANGANRIRINNYRNLRPEEVATHPLLTSGAHDEGQLITFDINSRGEIIGIDTAYDNTASRTPEPSRFTLNIQDTMRFTSNNQRLTVGNTSVRVNANTLVFDIPENSDGDTTLFAIRNINMFTNETEYNVKVFDMTEDFVARVIVVTSAMGTTQAGAAIAVVDRLVRTHNTEMAETERLHAFQNGQAIDVLAADINTLRKANGNPLQQGDIIQFRTNVRGEIDAITVLFDTEDLEPNAIHRDTQGIIDVTDNLTVAFGRVTRRFAGSVNMSINDVIHNFSTTNVHVYEFDSLRNTNRVRVVTPGDIRIFETPGHEWYLFVKIYRGVVEEMVIIR